LGRFYIPNIIANLPDTLQQIKKSLLVKVDIPIDTKRLVRISLYPSKINPDIWRVMKKSMVPKHHQAGKVRNLGKQMGFL